MTDGEPRPDRIVQTLNAYQQTEALRAAIELDLFSSIARGRRTVSELAAADDLSEKGVRILCDSMVILGLLSKEGERYALDPEAARYLDRAAPGYIGSAAGFLLSSSIREGFRNLAAAVRQGGTALEGGGTVRPQHEVWVDFARGMAPMMRGTAESLAAWIQSDGEPPSRVLDIAAGHGLFGIEVGRRNPAARIHAVDWPAVLEVARENAACAGIVDRYHGIPGDALQVPLGRGYDLAILANILHHFDAATCTRLLRNVRDALEPGGRAVLLEYVPDEDRVSPPRAAGFALVMLATTPAGDAYTFDEYRAMLHDAGFGESRKLDLADSLHQVVVAIRS